MFPGIYEQAYKTPKAGWNLKSNAPVADDDVVTKSAMSSVEELRKMSICVPLYWRSTTLPPNSMWANGDLVLFENWPDVTEIYTNGGFSGMLLPYNADSATIAANIGMWRPNAASPTGLFAPN
ncbi:MAG: hypothetical protein LBQ51_10755, partial [Desulfovibrio sp.]|nr:hypothetical protein [Desulfovibrio sp.]